VLYVPKDKDLLVGGPGKDVVIYFGSIDPLDVVGTDCERLVVAAK
jgi:hypothetical protein